MKNKIFTLTLALAVGFFLCNLQLVALALDPYARPEFGSGSGSLVGVDQTDTLTNIKLNNDTKGTAIINWNSFNVGSQHTVNWEFGAHSQTALNLVNAASGLSQIYGKLTNSCGGGGACGYQGTGKVILLNPNGVTFFNGSSVNLNSFTVSSYDAERKDGHWWTGKQDDFSNSIDDKWQLVLKDHDNAGDIIIENGATIHADKQLAFAAPNVIAYKGSVLSTSKDINYSPYGYGNVRIFTGDGVTFEYQETSNIYGSDAKATSTSKEGTIHLNGTIDTGKIQAVNMSTNANSGIKVGEALAGDSTNPVHNTILKATKIINGEEGSIILEAANDIKISNNAVLQALNGSNGANKPGGVGKIDVIAKGNVSIDNAQLQTSTTNAGTANINVASLNKSVNITNSNLNAYENVNIAGATGATVEGSTVTGKNVTVGEHTYNGASGTTKITSTNNTVKDSTVTATGFAKIIATISNFINNSKINAPTVAVTANTGNNQITNGSVIANGNNMANTVTIEATNGTNTVQGSTIKGTTTTLKSGTLTDIDASDLYYNDLNVNGNLRIANNSSFSDMNDTDVTIKTDGYIKVEDSDNIYTKKTGAKDKQNSLTLQSTDSDVIFENATVNTANDANIIADKGSASFNNSKVKSDNSNVNVTAYKGFNDASFTNSTLEAANNVTVTSTNESIKLTSLDPFLKGGRLILNGYDVELNHAGADLNVVNTDFNASHDAKVTNSGQYDTTLDNVNLIAANDVIIAANATSSSEAGQNFTDKGNLTLLNVSAQAGGLIDVYAKRDISTIDSNGNYTDFNINNSKLYLHTDYLKENLPEYNANYADQGRLNLRDINIKLANASNKDKGVVIEGYNVQIASDGPLSISKLHSHNDMYLDQVTGGIIASTETNPVPGNTPGLDSNGNPVTGKDDTPRVLIEVDGWNFISPSYIYDSTGLTGNEAYQYESYDPISAIKPGETEAKDYNQRHYITYVTNGEEQKVFLVHKQPANCDPGPTPNPPDSNDSGITDGSLYDNNILRLPLKYEPTSNLAPITDNRVGMDVVQQAAQIQVSDDEEDEYGY